MQWITLADLILNQMLQVEAAVEAFLSTSVSVLQGLTGEQFAQHVQSLTMLKLEPYQNVSERAEDHWSAVMRTSYDFYERYEVRVHLRWTACCQF